MRKTKKTIAIIGAGASGVYFALRLKEYYLDKYNIYIYEGSDRPMKKLLLTGNGKCNFANANSFNLLDQYSTKDVEGIITSTTHKEINDEFKRLGIETKRNEDLYYPYSETSKTVYNKLFLALKDKDITLKCSLKLINYKKIDNEYELEFVGGIKEYADYVIFATGGLTYPKTGSDGSLFPLFKNRGYEIKDLSPSLCPIKIKENTKLIEGLRHKSLVSLYQKDTLIHEEEGEVLFKDGALSGIVIFNMSFHINKLNNKDNIRIVINLAKDHNKIKENEYENYVHPLIASYLIKHNQNINKLTFTFKSLFDYETSQVTFGGVSLKNMKSQIEEGIFFIGETLEVSASCGGYNLMWAFASADYVAKKYF